MSESTQRALLVFGVIMVAMLACLVALQVFLGGIVEGEPRMVNPRSLAVSGLFAAGLTFAIVNREPHSR